MILKCGIARPDPKSKNILDNLKEVDYIDRIKSVKGSSFRLTYAINSQQSNGDLAPYFILSSYKRVEA